MKSKLTTSIRFSFLHMNLGVRIILSACLAVSSLSLKAHAQDERAHTEGPASLMLAAGSARTAPRAQSDLVEFEKMTWVEVKNAIAAGSPQNGILGDARRSTVELGKLAFDMKVDYAVRQIRSLLPTS